MQWHVNEINNNSEIRSGRETNLQYSRWKETKKSPDDDNQTWIIFILVGMLDPYETKH